MPHLLESDHCEAVPPKFGLCSEANTGDTSPKKNLFQNETSDEIIGWYFSKIKTSDGFGDKSHDRDRNTAQYSRLELHLKS